MVPISLLALLVFASIVPLASGQTGASGLENSASRLLPDIMHEETVLEDAQGDVGLLFGIDTPGLPATTPDQQQADILRLDIGENLESLVFSLYHATYDADAWTVRSLTIGRLDCDIEFFVNGHDDVEYRIEFQTTFDVLGEVGFFATLERRSDDGRDRSIDGGFPASLVHGDHIEVVLPKSLFDDPKDESLIEKGDELTDVRTDCSSSHGFIVQASDDVDADSAIGGTLTYTLAAGGVSEDVAIIAIDAHGEMMLGHARAIAAGTAMKLSFVVVNFQERKALINLTSRLTDDFGQLLDDWAVVHGSTVEVRANNHTRVSVVVTPPADAAHRERAYLGLVAKPLGSSDQVMAQHALVVAQPLSPERSTLYFHNSEGFSCFICTGASSLLPDGDMGPVYFALNVLQDDPGFDREAQAQEPARMSFAEADGFAVMDVPTVHRHRLDVEQPAWMNLTIGSGVARTIDIAVELYDGFYDRFLGRGHVRHALASGGTTAAIPIQLLEEAEDLPPGRQIFALIDVFDETGVFFGDQVGPELSWYPDRSNLQLPLLPVAVADVNITDGRAFPTIALRNGTEIDEYVNPGERRVFEFSLVNEGAEDDILDVTVSNDDPAWTHQILPGNRFRLEPGRSAPFSLVVRAADDAAEGDIRWFNLTAKSANDERVRSTLSVRAIVTTGIDIEDQDYQPAASDERVDPYVEAEESPGLTFLLPGLLFLAVAWIGRRQRTP